MKVENWEKEIQGGALCNVCGSDRACGNIKDCAWWTSDYPKAPYSRFNSTKKPKVQTLNNKDHE